MHQDTSSINNTLIRGSKPILLNRRLLLYKTLLERKFASPENSYLHDKFVTVSSRNFARPAIYGTTRLPSLASTQIPANPLPGRISSRKHVAPSSSWSGPRGDNRDPGDVVVPSCIKNNRQTMA